MSIARKKREQRQRARDGRHRIMIEVDYEGLLGALVEDGFLRDEDDHAVIAAMEAALWQLGKGRAVRADDEIYSMQDYGIPDDCGGRVESRWTDDDD